MGIKSLNSRAVFVVTFLAKAYDLYREMYYKTKNYQCGRGRSSLGLVSRLYGSVRCVFAIR